MSVANSHTEERPALLGDVCASTSYISAPPRSDDSPAMKPWKKTSKDTRAACQRCRRDALSAADR